MGNHRSDQPRCVLPEHVYSLDWEAVCPIPNIDVSKRAAPATRPVPAGTRCRSPVGKPTFQEPCLRHMPQFQAINTTWVPPWELECRYTRLMSLCADLVAWGPYSSEIARYLEYPPEFYRSTRPGALVVTELFGIAEGTSASIEFAACFGITDVWDFNQHQIDPNRIDLDRLRTVLRGLEYADDYVRHVDVLLALRASGFEFMFRPNG